MNIKKLKLIILVIISILINVTICYAIEDQGQKLIIENMLQDTQIAYEIFNDLLKQVKQYGNEGKGRDRFYVLIPKIKEYIEITKQYKVLFSSLLPYSSMCSHQYLYSLDQPNILEQAKMFSKKTFEKMAAYEENIRKYEESIKQYEESKNKIRI